MTGGIRRRSKGRATSGGSKPITPSEPLQSANRIQGGVKPIARVDDAPRTDATPTLKAPDAPSPKKAPKRSRFFFRADGASRFGRAVRLGVTAAMMGALIGVPGSSPTNNPGPRIEQVAEAPPQGNEVETFSAALAEIGETFAPGLTREQVLSRLRYASFSITLDDGLVPGPDGTGLEAPPGTRLQVRIDRGGFSIVATPSVQWRADWAPDPTVRSIRFDFHTGTFSADAEGLGLDSWYENSISSLADEHMRPRMPAAMQEPGYDPFSDPELETRLQQVVDLFSGTASEASRSGSASSPRFGFGFTVPDDVTLPLAETGSEANIAAGTRVDFDARLAGGFSELRLDRINVDFSEPVGITKAGESDAVLARMDLSQFSLQPGGQVSLQYRLGPEDAVDGVRALGLLIAVLAEPQVAMRSDIHFSPSQMEGLREDVQERIDGELEPRLIEMIRDNDEAIPGMSLMRFFGLEPTPDLGDRG